MKLGTPILFIIFNRVEPAARVFDAIRKVRPTKLFVAADGPRPECAEDIKNCALTRNLIAEIDWECDLKTLFRDTNLGCGLGVCSAVDWFFNQVEEGIILEDDCLPTASFFRFCEELLDRFRHDNRVMSISGNNFQAGKRRGDGDYYFSNYGLTWGWATWQRSWKYNDFNLVSFRDFKERNQMANVFPDKSVQKYWMSNLSDPEIIQKTWDYQWYYSIWRQNGLSIVPNVNLVSNIGFGSDATHTLRTVYLTSEDRELSKLEAHELKFPLKHPSLVLCDMEADRFTSKNRFNINPFIQRFWQRIRRNLFGIKR